MDILSQELVFTPLPAPEVTGRQILFQYGWSVFEKGYPLNFVTTQDARRGWLAAQRAEMASVDCDTAAYLAQVAEAVGW